MSTNVLSSETVDLVIIGGGLWGLSIAWHYAHLGAGRVMVLERNTLASAATSRAAALLTRARAKTVLMPLIAQTYADIATLEAELGESLDLRQVGSLYVAASESRQRELRELVAIAEQARLRVEWVSMDEANQRVPWLNPEGVAAAAFMPEDAFIDPYRLAMAYAQSARMHGAILHQGVAVHALRRQGDRVTGVVTDQGIVYADCVVNAAGAWANRLALPLGVGLPMTPVRSQYWISVPDSLFPRDHPMVIMPDASAYSRPELGGLLFGLREQQSVSVDPRDLPDSVDGFAFGEEGGWSSLVEGAPALRRFSRHWIGWKSLTTSLDCPPTFQMARCYWGRCRDCVASWPLPVVREPASPLPAVWDKASPPWPSGIPTQSICHRSGWSASATSIR